MNYEIVLATNNKHKLQEVREVMSPHGIVVYSPNDLNIKSPVVEENGANYYENALIKAKSLAKLTSFPVIADDSGLEVKEMNNAPGLYSARFASELGGHDKAIQKILDNVKEKDRSARFICSIVLCNVETTPLRFEAIVDGVIADQKEGDEGFGYDPIFIPNGYEHSYATLSKEEKNKISHRALALKKLLVYLRISGFIKK